MKKQIIKKAKNSLLALPCIAAFSEGDSVLINIIGLAYTFILLAVTNTPKHHSL